MCESHREKIQQLWDRLQVPQEEREAFNEHMVMSKRRNLEAVRRIVALHFQSPAAAVFLFGLHIDFLLQLQAEVRRLEELKLLNIRNVTDAIRSEIAVFWEKCFLSTDQRQAFAPYFSGGFALCFCHFRQNE